MSEWSWVELATVLAIHEELLQQHGGLGGVRERGALESALQRPANLVHDEEVDDPCELAAAYLVAVAKAHAFADGNKRSAWTTAALFLELNTHDIEFDAADALAMVVGAADSSVTQEQVAAWFRLRCRPR